ncbi:MAG: DUF4349 domain-containing protein [Isosphaeraceae bacterium]
MNASRILASALPLIFSMCGCGAPEGASYPYYAAERAAIDQAPQAGSAESPPPTQESAAVPRKIIYTADLDLVVEDFDAIEDAVPRLVAESGGYVSHQDINGTAGSLRRGSWTVRVPIEKFDTFLRQATALGEAQRSKLDTKDVTEQYFDTEGRLKNKAVQEQRLRAILEERTGKLEDVLAVEKELARVRGEIEQLEGSLRLLTNLSSLTTITITITQRRDYNPPAAPDFATRIGRTFADSLETLRKTGEAVVLTLVAIAPWIPVLLVAALMLWAARYLLGRRRATRTP